MAMLQPSTGSGIPFDAAKLDRLMEPRHDRHARTGIVKGRSAQSDSIAWTICRGRRGASPPSAWLLPDAPVDQQEWALHRALFMPLAALCRRHSSAGFTTNMSEFDFRQAQWSDLGFSVHACGSDNRFRHARHCAAMLLRAPCSQMSIRSSEASISKRDPMTFSEASWRSLL